MKVARGGLVGAIVAELPRARRRHRRAAARGSYYGQTIQIWAALFVGAALSAVLVGLIGAAGRVVERRMGFVTMSAAPPRPSRPADRVRRGGARACGRRSVRSAACRWSSCRRRRAILSRFVTSLPTLWVDFVQTLKAVLAGYAIGSAAGFVVAILIDRSPFLQRGLLPIGNFVSALPIVGIAPIMVMWFGFDWPSKAAVVVVMTFFPMLVNTLAGLAASDAMERDLMQHLRRRATGRRCSSCACRRRCRSSSMR